MRKASLEPKFVDIIPDHIEEGLLYICEQYQVAIHKCCCGCGTEVVTPLSPVDWSIQKSGDFITLLPSIGNWSFECKSHYWISKNRVIWACQFSKEQIDFVQAQDKASKEAYIKEVNYKKEEMANSNSFLTRIWNILC